MTAFRKTLRAAAISGMAAGVLSAATRAAMDKLEPSNVASPLKGPRLGLSRRKALEAHTTHRNPLPGVIIHQLTSILWAAIYARLFRRQVQAQSIPQQLVSGAASAATAYLVDYALTPKRVRSHIEKPSSSHGMFPTYAAFGISLVALGVFFTMKGGRR